LRDFLDKKPIFQQGARDFLRVSKAAESLFVPDN
jgi:hypothetical protein